MEYVSCTGGRDARETGNYFGEPGIIIYTICTDYLFVFGSGVGGGSKRGRTFYLSNDVWVITSRALDETG